MSPKNLLVRSRRRAGVAAAVLGLVALVAAPAAADPGAVSSKQAEAAQIAAQLEGLQHDAEVLAEQYNKAVIDLDRAGQDLVSAQSELAAREKDLVGLSAQLARFALQTYVFGDQFDLVAQLAGDGSQVSRETYASVFVTDRQRVERAVQAARVAAESDRALVATRRSSQDALTQQVAAKKDAVLAKVDATQQLLGQVKGELATAVAAEQLRLQQEAQRQQAQLLFQATSTTSTSTTVARTTTTARSTTTSTRPGPTTTRPGATTTTTRATTSTTSGGSSTTRGGSSTTGGGTTTTTSPSTSTTIYNGPPPPPPSPKAAGAIAAARTQLGVPYVFAMATPGVGFDCSGLTMWAWGQVGVSMYHYTGIQLTEFPRVALDQLAPGDLVFFHYDYTHVGLYIGGGMMIEAPYTGSYVRISSAFSRIITAAVRPG